MLTQLKTKIVFPGPDAFRDTESDLFWSIQEQITNRIRDFVFGIADSIQETIHAQNYQQTLQSTTDSNNSIHAID